MVFNNAMIYVFFSVGAASFWRKRAKEETCTGYSLDWAVRSATPLSELRLEHKVEGQEDWLPAQEVRLTVTEATTEATIEATTEATTEAGTGGPATNCRTYIGTTTVPKNVIEIRWGVVSRHDG